MCTDASPGTDGGDSRLRGSLAGMKPAPCQACAARRPTQPGSGSAGEQAEAFGADVGEGVIYNHRSTEARRPSAQPVHSGNVCTAALNLPDVGLN